MEKLKIKLIQKMKKKFGSCCGETIAETLVSLLIAALALTMLAGAMSSSLKMVTKSRNKLNAYSEKTESMVTGSGTEGTITIKVDALGTVLSDAGLNLPEYKVQYFFNNEFNSTPVAVYKYLTPTTGG